MRGHLTPLYLLQEGLAATATPMAAGSSHWGAGSKSPSMDVDVSGPTAGHLGEDSAGPAAEVAELPEGGQTTLPAESVAKLPHKIKIYPGRPKYEVLLQDVLTNVAQAKRPYKFDEVTSRLSMEFPHLYSC